MLARCNHVAAVLFGFVLAALLHAKFTFEPREHKGMEATLTVEAGEQTTERGLGDVTLALTIKGPASLDVEEPRFGDAAAAWKEERLGSSRVVEGQRAIWSQIIHLKQVKRGIEPVPDVTVRFRRDAEAVWIEEKWIDILRYIQDGTGSVQPVEQGPSWLRRWGFVLVLVTTSLLVLLAWSKKRHRVRQVALPPDRWALREIDRIAKKLMPLHSEAETYHTQISLVVRRYLTERFGLHALQQTTAEFLESIRQLPQLSAELQAILTELFERCDLAKFARAVASPRECQRTTELARDLVKQTTKELETFHHQ